MDGTASPGPAGPPQALLDTMANLARFHREHEEFYASAPREQAVLLQRDARTLLALADRWSEGRPATPSPLNPFEGAEDLTAPVGIQLRGVLFMEGEGEPVELARLKRDLVRTADDLRSGARWLAEAMQASWDSARALLDLPDFADLLGERHRIIANDWQAAHHADLAGLLLQRAADVLERVELGPAVLRADLAAGPVGPQRLYSAAELVARAADLLSESAGLVHDNERRWRAFRARVDELRRDV
ncbi:hypothetical protein [Kitasatospora sp. DSM 101779]|uniref:hypothetical protein n=1 Tax=Kitasatospora sp. DSM 101779 TaxID=2853165 RepID=UPI0021D7F8CF|nr:hypothetical protein [Kitasatospora sp. DSM 101779]MCU7826496.1 hypothetical protein [Kitasatospora sp. DSM 101779]